MTHLKETNGQAGKPTCCGNGQQSTHVAREPDSTSCFLQMRSWLAHMSARRPPPNDNAKKVAVRTKSIQLNSPITKQKDNTQSTKCGLPLEEA